MKDEQLEYIADLTVRDEGSGNTMLLPRDFVERCARSFPAKVAYIDGPRKRTWREIEDRSNRLAVALQEVALVNKGDAVAILTYDCVEMIEHWYACTKIGALRTGINWRYAPREMAHIVRDSDAKVLILGSELVSTLDGYIEEFEKEGRIVIGVGDSHGKELDYEEVLQNEGVPELPTLSEEDLVAISYTSGSTGLPKGVLLSQRNVREAIVHTTLSVGFRHEDVWVNAVPMAGGPMLFSVYNMVNGMTSVLLGAEFDARRFLELTEQHGVTSAVLVPTMLRRVIDEARAGSFDTSSLRLICYGSMPTTPALISAAYDTFACEFQQWYGTTEITGGFATFLRAYDHKVAYEEGRETLFRSCGTPLLHVEVSVRDPVTGEAQPPGREGEIWIAGDVVMQGYLNSPEENMEVFAGRWMRTGDIGLFDELGYLYLTDRKKFMIVSGGYNVYPTVVENVLAEHGSVGEVAVVGAPHPEWGECVVAAVSLRAGCDMEAGELIEFCRGKVGKWEVPKHVEIVGELPKGATAKVQKDEVRDWFRRGVVRVPWSAQV